VVLNTRQGESLLRDASDYYVYTYSIELSDTSTSSIDSVMFEGETVTGGRRSGRSYSATSGTATVLSNGVAPIPEPASGLVFAIGFAAIAARCRSKASRA
jgi:hypothetical protein